MAELQALPALPALNDIGNTNFIGTSTSIPGSAPSLSSISVSPDYMPFGSSTIGQALGMSSASDGTTANSIASSVSGTNWTQLFLRAVVIILGFIFMAVGLSMFKTAAPIIIQQTGRGAMNLGKKVIGKK